MDYQVDLKELCKGLDVDLSEVSQFAYYAHDEEAAYLIDSESGELYFIEVLH